MKTITKTKFPIAAESESNMRIYDFLAAERVGVLATVDPNDNPHATPIYYSVDENFNITFATKNGTKKHDNLVHNNKAVLVVFEPISQTTAQITGLAENITNTATGQETFSNMLRAAEETSDTGIPPISKVLAGQYVAWRIKPRQVRMAMFVRPDPGGYDIYETIDFD